MNRDTVGSRRRRHLARVLVLPWVVMVSGAFGPVPTGGRGGTAVATVAAAQPALLGDCKCADRDDLINRKYEVASAIAALKQEFDIVMAGGYAGGNPRAPYVDSRDRHLLEDDIQNAINAVHDPGIANRVKNMTFPGECVPSVQGYTPCLNGAAKAGEAAYLAYCETRQSVGNSVKETLRGRADWQENTSVALMLEKAIEAYQAEEKYIDEQLSALKDRCKTKGWNGTVVVSYEDKYNDERATPGTIRGTITVEDRDYRDAIIAVVNGKAVGELSAGITHKEHETKSGQTSCHGGGVTPKLTSFSSTSSTAIEKHGDFFSRPSVRVSFDQAGGYRVSVTMKGGYGYGTSAHSLQYQGECGKSTPEVKTFLPKQYLDGIDVTGKGRGKSTDLELHDSDTPVQLPFLSGRVKTVRIEWHLTRSR